MKTVKGRIILKTQLVLFIAILVATSVNIWYLGNGLLEKSKASLQAHSDYYASIINTAMEEDTGIVEGMRAAIIANGFDEEQIKNIQNLVDVVYENNNDLLGVYYAGADGTFFTKSASGQIAADYDPTVRDWYKQTVEAGETIILSPYKDATTGLMCVSAVTPIYKDGTLMGCCGVDLLLSRVVDSVNAIDYTEGSYGIIVDSDMNIVTHPNKEYHPTEDNKTSIGQLISDLDGADLDNQEIIYVKQEEGQYIACSKIDTAGWYLLTVIPSALVSGTMMKTVGIAILIGLAFVIVTILIDLVILRRQLAPISGIIETSKKISQGDFDVELNVKKKDELGELQKALAEMINNIESVISEQNAVLYEIASGNLAGMNMSEYPGEFNEISESINSIKARLNELIGDIQFSAINLQSTAIGFGYAIEPEEMEAVLKELSHEANELMNKANMFKTKIS